MPAGRRNGAPASMPSSITPTLTPWPAVEWSAPQSGTAPTSDGTVSVRVVGRDGIDAGHARQPLHASERAHGQPQRDRVEHDAVAPLHGGRGHGGAQPRREDVLDAAQPSEVEPRAERRGVQPRDAADAHQLPATRRNERERRWRQAHDDVARRALPAAPGRCGEHAGATHSTSPESVCKKRPRAPGARGHVERTRSAAMRAASVGLMPTGMPRASSASFLPCAVPEDPEMIAPAWPMVLPAGAEKPAM